jgi:hypothetical protein
MKPVYFSNSEFAVIYIQDIHKNIHTTSLEFTVHIHNNIHNIGQKYNIHNIVHQYSCCFQVY